MRGGHDPRTGPMRSCPILIRVQSRSRAPYGLATLSTPAHRYSIEGDFRLRLLRHVGRRRGLLAFVFQRSTAERTIGWRLGIHGHSGFLRRRFAPPEWSLPLLPARLLGICGGPLFGKWSRLTMLCPLKPLVLL